METMEVSVVFKQFIKPSSPTPPHLATLTPSFLDQLPLSPFAPLVLLYSQHPPIDFLKTSLAETLTLFYPLAGAIKDDKITVDCNDQGAYFVEARVKGRVKDLLARPDQHLIDQLFPPTTDMFNSASVAIIQANSFECGGLAIACCLRHVCTDGIGLASFLKAWAATTFSSRDGNNSVVSPDFTASTLFPTNPNDTSIRDKMSAMCAPFAVAGRFVRKRVLLNPSSVRKLQDGAGGEAGRRPSRFEAVSACVWRSFSHASRINKGGDDPKSTAIMLPVNIRRRASTLPINDHSMGNLVLHAWAKLPESYLATHSHSGELSPLACKIREAVARVDSGVVARLNREVSDALKSLLDELSEELAGCRDFLYINSWCNFGLTDVNFGRGDPVWAAPGFLMEPGSRIGHLCGLLDAADGGGGIEAWVFTTEPYMDSFVRDLEQNKVDFQVL